MSKELTPLEALKELRSFCEDAYYNEIYDKDYRIIETALKDIDYIKSLRENQKRNIELLIEENRTMKKSFEALAVIKNVRILEPYKTSGGQYWLETMCDASKITKEEYDLLKEIL